MKSGISVFLLLLLVLFSACTAAENPNNDSNVSRDQAIQTVRNISDSTGDLDVQSYPEMDKVIENTRYYFIKVVFANKMSAAYFVDEKEGKVFIAVGGDLDIENPLPVAESNEPVTSSHDQDTDELAGVIEITGSATAVIKDIFDAMGMSQDQVELKFGSGYKKVSVNYDGYMEGYLYSDKGITVAFGSDGKVACVYCTDKIDINGAKSGMNFSQIQDKLGDTVFHQTWAETPINAAYEIKYTFDDRIVVFFSREKEGSNSIMSIR